ncbi:hypothetical protein IWQ57_000894 [Coemansia nantahalensis]|uniref:Uncharacterized protein n=1 Tax=Coemansia nantahalensis TaxID=2789366 RepID=A0ACC1K6L6_9FUNG|nr:hypothetical protein IWQ57_000894 [Coemansia nantahalensis]
MKLATLSAGLVAICSLFASTDAAPASSTTKGDINFTCAYRISYQLIGYVSNNDVSGGWAQCKPSNVGYTAGFARFTTQYGSVLAVVDNYKESSHYKEEFDDIYEAIKTAASDPNSPNAKLDGFCDAWAKAAKNGSYFALSQIVVARKMYETPTKAYVKEYKIKFPLTRAALIYLAMSNGVGETGKTLGAMIKKTNAKFTADVTGESGNSLKVGQYSVDEAKWLGALLDETDSAAFAFQSDVLSVFRTLINDKQFKLSSTITFKGLQGKQVKLTCKKLTASMSK